jgi:hypothetical protein
MRILRSRSAADRDGGKIADKTKRDCRYFADKGITRTAQGGTVGAGVGAVGTGNVAAAGATPTVAGGTPTTGGATAPGATETGEQANPQVDAQKKANEVAAGQQIVGVVNELRGKLAVAQSALADVKNTAAGMLGTLKSANVAESVKTGLDAYSGKLNEISGQIDNVEQTLQAMMSAGEEVQSSIASVVDVTKEK